MAGTASAGATTADSGGDGGVKEQAQEKAQEVREKAGEQVRNASGQARDRVRSQVDERSTQVGQQVSTQAGDLRTVADQLREQGKDSPARMVEQVADRAERAGSWLTESDADRILGDVEDFARSKPWAVAAGGLALGFAASRVLKASSSRRYEQRGTAGQLPRAGGTTSGRPVTAPADRIPAAPTPADPTLGAPVPATPPTPASSPVTPAEGERFRSPGGGL
jgi:gas vesicle protein